ncbi:MAG: ribosome silencing factor [Clostridiales bacterium]|nr:ribosome silencing factor [Clostridiales bacterium]
MDQRALAQRIAHILYDKKAWDITVLDVGHLTVITDYMVIASGRSTLQVKSLADDVDDALALEGVTLRAREGTGEGRWIVLDYGTVLVHIFHPEDRQFYHLERLWEDGQNRLPLPFLTEEENKPE